MFCSHNGKYTKWYYRNEKRQIYIPKSNRPLAEALAAKKYLQLRLQDLITEKASIDSYLKNHKSNPLTSDQFLMNSPEYQELLSSFFTPTSLEISAWLNSPFEKNLRFPEQIIHRTISGIYVRSKSEALIATLLYTHKIPFRYECALHLGELTFYPDFTIMHPITHKIYYWEHFGLMDDSQYCQKTFSKLEFYASHDILPSHQLITTFENKTNPLDSEYVNSLIEHYFL